jgi:dTDP-4-amino-4,6-dideoxygalactose transaminase
MKVPFLDLRSQHRELRGQIRAAIRRTLDRGRFILGEEVAAFEEEFAAFCGARYAVGVASGTEAIQLALLACGLQPGDEVITSAFTTVPTLAAIELAGGRPVLVDIDPQRLTLDPGRVEAAVTRRTRALLPVHLYGCPADLAPLVEIARARRLVLVEDCAQAHGARYRGQPAGTWGQAGAFSFYPTKNLGACGDGGAVVCGDPGLAARLRSLREYGWDSNRLSQMPGVNSRLDELQAAILRVKLRRLPAWNARRRELAGLYCSLLQGSSLQLPLSPEDSEAVHHLFVVRHPERDALGAFLAARGIQTMIHYPVPPHLQPAYADLGYRRGDLPEAERAAAQVLSLPLIPQMPEQADRAVCRAALEFLRAR